MRDRKQQLIQKLDTVYSGLRSELMSDQAEAARIIARSGIYTGLITGITGSGYRITISEGGKHTIEEGAGLNPAK